MKKKERILTVILVIAFLAVALYELFPIGVPVVMMVLSLLFCAIQAVVFTMLTAIYIEEATEPV